MDTPFERFLEAHLKLATNPKARKLAAVSCGINFLGYVTHPSHRLPRRRVVGNFQRRLADFKKRLERITRFGIVIHEFDNATIEQLLAVLNSYLAHMSRASSRRIIAETLGRHPWLNTYFDFVNGNASRKWRPPIGFSRLAYQVDWFRRSFPVVLIFFQVGSHYELFGKDADWMSARFGTKLISPRFRGESRVGFPCKAVNKSAFKVIIEGGNVLVVNQTGYWANGIAERHPSRIYLLSKRQNHASAG